MPKGVGDSVCGTDRKSTPPICAMPCNIMVEVVRIQGNRITLGIAAPADVKILRGELKQPKAKTETVELVIDDGLLVAC